MKMRGIGADEDSARVGAMVLSDSLDVATCLLGTYFL